MPKTMIIEEEEEINQLTDGQYFGEYDVIEARPRLASAYAIEDTHLFVIDRTTFNKSIGVRYILCRNVY
jgi:CRP-like cAMP-binding protein